MKIALIGMTLFNQGAAYVLATLARGLTAHGHDITVILSQYHDDWQMTRQVCLRRGRFGK